MGLSSQQPISHSQTTPALIILAIGLSLFQPDFLISSFYKICGENPSGFACLFGKKSVVSVLEVPTSTGIVNLIPAKQLLQIAGDSSGTDTELEQICRLGMQLDALGTASSFSGLISNHTTQARRLKQERSERAEEAANCEEIETSSEFCRSEKHANLMKDENSRSSGNGDLEVVCRGLDLVDSLGLMMITNRARYLINWVVSSLRKLKHPNSEGIPLVKIYGPKIKFDRGPALAFNVYDWKGEKVEHILMQKLADRNNISLSYGFLHQIWFSDKYTDEKRRILEKREGEEEESGSGSDSEPEEPLPPKTSSSAPVAEKKPPPKKPDSSAINSKPQFSSSGSEDDSGSDVDKDLVVKPIASKPMEETPKTKRPRSKPAATATPAAKSGSKRPSETQPKDSKRPKKKGAAVEQEPDQVEEEAKKSKLFQRIWSDEDEVIILKGMVDYTTKKGADPYSDMGAFHDFIKKSLKVDAPICDSMASSLNPADKKKDSEWYSKWFT